MVWGNNCRSCSCLFIGWQKIRTMVSFTEFVNLSRKNIAFRYFENSIFRNLFRSRLEPSIAGQVWLQSKNRRVVDLTSKDAPLSCDICEMEDPVGFIRSTVGLDLGDIDEISANPVE